MVLTIYITPQIPSLFHGSLKANRLTVHSSHPNLNYACAFLHPALSSGDNPSISTSFRTSRFSSSYRYFTVSELACAGTLTSLPCSSPPNIAGIAYGLTSFCFVARRLRSQKKSASAPAIARTPMMTGAAMTTTGTCLPTVDCAAVDVKAGRAAVVGGA
jgi:hypothetical protein